jgi:preprotein translocase subunit SecD
MRGRSIRLSVLILAILALSVAALAFPEINIDLPGFPALRRGGAGPLGLKLGLDLRGGAHLVYQADVGSRIQASFSEPVDEAEINEILTAQGLSNAEVETQNNNSVHIETALLDNNARQRLRAALDGWCSGHHYSAGEPVRHRRADSAAVRR